MSDWPANIVGLVKAEKALLRSPTWDSKSDDRYHVLTAPLIIGGDDITGFQIRAKTSKRYVDRDALCQLEFAETARRVTPLWRCEWRPFSGHTNRAWGPPGFELMVIQGSHEHPFPENWCERESRMRGSNLPAAIPINDRIETLSSFLAFCGERYRINNIDRIEPPLISPDLFWKPDD